MTSSGVGRGRGWLNLNKNPSTATVPRPGLAPSPQASHHTLNSQENTSYVDSLTEYADLINKLKQLNINDDGILFNQKIKYIIENWTEECKGADEVEQSFEAIHQACLQDANLTSKLVLMIASRSFISQEIRDQNIRLMFLRKLQNNFETSKQLQVSNPTAFRNSVQMLGEFYNKARLANGQQLTFMASPFISYLEMLLDSAQASDLKLFTIQLYLNGSSIKSESPEKMTEMLNNVRLMLSTDRKLSNESKLWLLLALDVSSNRFGLLPSEVHKFYEDQLGDAAMASFQGSHGTLSVQTTHTSKTLDSYQSSVNVLQVTTPTDSGSEQISSPPHSKDFNNCNSGFLSDSSQNSSSTRWETNNASKPAGGRPILGAGARLNKSKSGDEAWKNNSSGWNNKQKNSSGWGESKRGGSKNKAWEHDDRFENEYS